VTSARVLDPRAQAVVDRLHTESDRQARAMARARARAGKRAPVRRGDARDYTQTPAGKALLADKLVALDRDKAELCYALCRATNARRVVEAGTSFGVSTVYLAAAVRDNGRPGEPLGVVIGTEHEPGKARAARETFAAAGVADFVDLREGDLRETLRSLEGPIDFMLSDIWIPLARPALELVAPRMRVGAIVVCDNTKVFRSAYREYLAFVGDPANGFATMTLPFDGGLELSVKVRPGPAR
jgi:predicted O-methyltransferase YrrM